MKQLICSLALFVIVFSFVDAQNYNAAIGARFGSPLSVSFKKFINDAHAVEAYVGFRNFSTYNWFTVSGAYQVHKDIDSIDGLQWYYGLGGSAYFWSFDFEFLGDRSVGTTFGIQGYLGLDYKLENIPVSLTVDWVPTFFVNGFGSGFGGGYGALGIRYVIGE